MGRLRWLILLAGCLGVAELSSAQEKTVLLCDPADPENQCPGERCRCRDDTLEITFDGGTQSILEYDAFCRAQEVRITVVTETVTPDVTGWSYGVAHDMDDLTVLSAGIEETVVSDVLGVGFDSTTINNIYTCGSDPACDVDNRTEGGGWISAVVLPFIEPVYLPPGRNSIARAAYRLERDVGQEGTLIEISNRIGVTKSPPTDVSFVSGGNSAIWTTGIHGWIKAGTQSPSSDCELVHELCDADDPANDCPGEDCRCAADSLEVTFDGGGLQHIYEYGTYSPGMNVTATVVTETRTELVQGWQYGVAHDMEDLQIIGATTAGTIAGDVEDGPPGIRDIGFDVTGMEDVQTCGPDPECTRSERTDGGGWISAVVLSFIYPVYLPLDRNPIAIAEYTLLRDVGAGGTLLRITDRLARRGPLGIELNLTVNGYSRVWATAIDGWIRRAGDGPSFLRADVGLEGALDTQPADGIVDLTDAVRILRYLFLPGVQELACEKAADVDDNGNLEVTDSVYLLSHLFRGEAPPPAPFPTPGEDPTADDLGCDVYP